MDSINWQKIAYQSEKELSIAYGGTSREFVNFTHIHNCLVPYAGDFNRAIGAVVTDIKSFDTLLQQVKKIHSDKNLDIPTRVDLYPPAIDENLWSIQLKGLNCILQTASFLTSTTKIINLDPELCLYTPSDSEYIDWFHKRMKERNYYSDDWYEKIKIPQLNFIQKFKPYWLKRGNKIIGWVYCALLDEYCRLFEVEIKEKFRGQGYGRILLDLIRNEGGSLGAKHILLQSNQDMKSFYEKVGFKECTTYSTIWIR